MHAMLTFNPPTTGDFNVEKRIRHRFQSIFTDFRRFYTETQKIGDFYDDIGAWQRCVGKSSVEGGAGFESLMILSAISLCEKLIPQFERLNTPAVVLQ
jgi:hypothetical protein